MRLLLSLVFLSGCSCQVKPLISWDYTVKCEAPYYSGPADRAFVSDYGIRIYLEDGKELSYPPSVKCEIASVRK